MKLREWLDREVDIATAVQGADPTNDSIVAANQVVLASVVIATQLLDARLERIEAHLGLETIDISTKGSGLPIVPRVSDE